MVCAVYRRAAEFIDADIGDELVALDLAAGNCFSFNPAATTVWHSLSSPKSFDELRDQLLGEYDVSTEQCTIELEHLLDDMVAKRLIEQIG